MKRIVPLYRPTSLSEIDLQQRHISVVVDQIDEYVQKGIDSIDKFQVGNDRETLALSTATNSLTADLQTVVFALARIIIKTYKNGHSDTGVGKIAKNFSNYIYSIQKLSTSDTGTLKEALKSGLNGVRDETHQLHRLLQSDAIRSNVATAIENVLFAVKKLYYRLLFESKSPKEMKDLHLKIKNEYVTEIKKITKEDDGTINNLLNHIHQALNRSFNHVRTINEEAYNFDDETRLELAEIAYSLHRDLAICHNDLRTKDEPGAHIEQATVCGRTVCNTVIALLGILDRLNSNTNVDLNLRNLILLSTTIQCAVGEGINDGVVHLG